MFIDAAILSDDIIWDRLILAFLYVGIESGRFVTIDFISMKLLGRTMPSLLVNRCPIF